MPKSQLKGKFDLNKFKKGVAQAENYTRIPELEYTIGEGETLDYLFDTLVTYRPLHGNKAVKKAFEGSFDGKTLHLNIGWLANSEGIPRDVEDALDEARKRQHELIKQEAQRH